MLAPAFYALKDARTPMIVSVVSIATNYVLNLLLVERFGHRGLAMATSGVALVNFIALFFLIRKKIDHIEGCRIFQSLWKILLASAVMALVSWIVYARISPQMGPGLGGQLANALIPIAAGAAVFFLLARLLSITDLESAERALLGKLLRRSSK